ncbi:MAG: hypothetical protein GYA35_01185 [Thermoanaerobaculaceae bacterium]|nr:hypothetical protein [Thermoanaerobaculaceae bacterium]
MKTIEYIFKSNPELKSKVPEEYGKRTDELIGLALGSKDKYDFLNKVQNHPYFKDKDIPGIIFDMMHLNKINAIPEEAIVEDRAYIFTCSSLYLNDLDNKTGYDRENLLKDIDLIIGVVDKLEDLKKE